MSGKIILATALAVTLASTAAASATVKKHKHYMRGATYGQTHKMGHPGSYGSPGNMTPGYSSTARHKPTDTNGGGGGSGK